MPFRVLAPSRVASTHTSVSVDPASPAATRIDESPASDAAGLRAEIERLKSENARWQSVNSALLARVSGSAAAVVTPTVTAAPGGVGEEEAEGDAAATAPVDGAGKKRKRKGQNQPVSQ